MSDTCQEQDETVRLVRASQGGDRVAFDRLVQLHQDQAMRVAFGVLGNVHDAAEVVQEAFSRVICGSRAWRPQRASDSGSSGSS